jgi:hypothetical protein
MTPRFFAEIDEADTRPPASRVRPLQSLHFAGSRARACAHVGLPTLATSEVSDASLRAAQPRGNPVAAAGLLRYARNDEGEGDRTT